MIHKPSVTAGVIVALICGALVYFVTSYRVHAPEVFVASSSPIPESWKTYANDELGLSFQYPPEWGTTHFEDKVISFSGNSDVRIGPFTGGEAVTCAFPKKITAYRQYYADGVGYCRQFENNDSETMIEEISIGTWPEAGGPDLRQHAFVSTFDFYQVFPRVNNLSMDYNQYLQSLLNRTAGPDVLNQIDTFEKVMLTLRVN